MLPSERRAKRQCAVSFAAFERKSIRHLKIIKGGRHMQHGKCFFFPTACSTLVWLLKRHDCPLFPNWGSLHSCTHYFLDGRNNYILDRTLIWWVSLFAKDYPNRKFIVWLFILRKSVLWPAWMNNCQFGILSQVSGETGTPPLVSLEVFAIFRRCKDIH